MTVLRDHSRGDVDREWVSSAVRRIADDARGAPETELLRIPLPAAWSIDLYMKDETTHPTGSLKHRLARALVIFRLCNGEIGPGTTLVEASSGSTAVSEAYFARMLGLPFVAVLPRSTSGEKIDAIVSQGGRCDFVDTAAEMAPEAARLAAACDGLFLDQFTNAERVMDWWGENVASSVLRQLEGERFPEPAWFVVGAGTGGTAAVIGRHVRLKGIMSRLCVVDPEGSAFHDAWHDDDPAARGRSSRIEGIGRPQAEPSFVPALVDRMVQVPDATSIAGMFLLQELTGRRSGPSTGTNLVGCLTVAAGMRARGESGSIVSLVCDGGERYPATYWSADWVAAQGWDASEPLAGLRQLLGG